jgi:hypothetical protein
VTAPTVLDLEDLEWRSAPRDTLLGPRNGAGNWLAATVFFLLAAGVLPLTLLSTGRVNQLNSLTVAIQMAVIIWCAVRLTGLVRTGKPAPMAIGFWIYTYVFLGLAPLTQVVQGRFPGAAGVSLESTTTASLIVLLGIASYDLLRIVYGRVRHVEHRTRRLVFSEPRTAALAALGLVLAVAYAGWMGLDVLFTSRLALDTTLRTLDPAVAAVFVAAGTVPVFVALLAVIAGKRRPSAPRWLAIAALTMANLTVTNVFSSPRYWVGTVFLSLVLTAGPPPGRRRFQILVAATLAGLLFVFPYADLYRNDRNASLQLAPISEQFATSGDYDSYQQITLGVAYTRINGMQMGRQLTGAALFFVPRSVWPAKPQDTGTVLAQSAGYRFTNLSAPLWIEGYLDFGPLGVILLLGGLGLVSATIDRRFAAGITQRGPWFVAGAILGFYQVLVLRGSLLQSMARLSVIVLCLVAVTAIDHVRRQRVLPDGA